MARYKRYSCEQGKFIPIYFEKQILPGPFEYALNHLIDHEIDPSVCDDLGLIGKEILKKSEPIGKLSLCKKTFSTDSLRNETSEACIGI
jgi:hypothetical protein